MAADGASVGIIYLSRASEAELVGHELREQGATVAMVQADVSDVLALNDAVDAIAAQLGGLDILVSVAGTSILGPLESLADDAFDRSFALNVRAPFLAAKKAASLMPPGGRIITIGSIVADRMPGAGGTLYAASKAALGGMTRGLARHLGSRGITANLVQPGPIDTERNPADGPNAIANRGPLAIARHGTPGEVASLVAYLASHEAGFITGSTYDIDGGWSA
ncbi:SDR family oxidoreductase [Sphingomonas natans]|uniref:SDR family oxidoreductase n=1 Tax=Sphingomonas natans TaxID=3063330 RepID=UPI003133BD59